MFRIFGSLVIIAAAGFIIFGMNSGDISTSTGAGAGILLIACLALLLFVTKSARRSP